MERKKALVVGLMLVLASAVSVAWYPAAAQEKTLTGLTGGLQSIPESAVMDGLISSFVEVVLIIVGPFIALIPECLTVSEVLHALANPFHTLMKLLEVPVVGPFLEDEICGTLEDLLTIVSVLGYLEILPLIMDLVLGICSDIPNAVANPFQTMKSAVSMAPAILSQYSLLGIVLVCLEALPFGFLLVWMRACWHILKLVPGIGWCMRCAQLCGYLLGPLI